MMNECFTIVITIIIIIIFKTSVLQTGHVLKTVTQHDVFHLQLL